MQNQEKNQPVKGKITDEQIKFRDQSMKKALLTSLNRIYY